MDDVLEAERRERTFTVLEGPLGRTLMHRASGTQGRVVVYEHGRRIVLEDPVGGRHEYTPFDGSFAHRGVAVALRPGPGARSAERRFTASGSVDAGPRPARVAAASRIWVEGLHDAELLERIWGDDLRYEGVVVEPMHGADDLPDRVAAFRPGPRRRLGILLDHLVEGSKESRLALEVARDPHVLVAGHPYVDVWQAIRPGAVGIDAWPAVPPGRPWKEGVVARLGRTDEPGAFWGSILDRVSDWRDVETPLVTAVERLIDFVTPNASRDAP